MRRWTKLWELNWDYTEQQNIQQNRAQWTVGITIIIVGICTFVALVCGITLIT